MPEPDRGSAPWPKRTTALSLLMTTFPAGGKPRGLTGSHIATSYVNDYVTASGYLPSRVNPCIDGKTGRCRCRPGSLARAKKSMWT